VAFGAPHLPPGVRLVLHDVTTPLGVDCDLLCARFLLTHLRNPGAALRTWYDGAAPHTLLCEELVDMTSELPELSRYYELVAHVQRAAGQDMNIGAKLDALVGTAGYALGPCGTTTLAFPVPTMARLHALNLPTLRLQPAVRERYTNDALDALQGRLEALRDGPHDGVVQVRMARVVAHRL